MSATAMPLWPVVQHALVWGLFLAAVLFAAVLAIVRFNAEIMLKDYPPDIQAAYGPMSERTKRQRIPIGILFVLALLAIVAGSFPGLREIVGGDVGFLPAFVHLATMFFLFNLLDWLVLDWLIVVRWRPRYIVLPGTEGLAGYESYWFHFRGFLIGLPISLAAGLLLAPLAAAVF